MNMRCSRLALEQRQLGGAHAIQEQDIEGEEDKLIGATLVHCRLKPAEDRRPFRIESA
jgi:hypothetical protein